MLKVSRTLLLSVVLAATASLAPAAFANTAEALVDAAQVRTLSNVRYDGKYVRLDYPGGDVDPSTGVCTDVIIRSFRAAFGYDLQKVVHEDMRANFSAYPANWGLSRPDKNIDHRRVPNLETYFKRKGAALPKSTDASNYLPGDIVSWRIGGRLPHIGIVTDRTAPDGTPLIVHNIGAGPVEDNILFAYPMTGHFRYVPTE
ncbi:DUF1287 domain-containing protein [Litorimonas sp. RW-G-Af-16]|uniref:DUF1287 domain-containing protein n=1 Tax=Litorimonas sp. RW-G-Af-16 TaxID=3241168 RepID=UPI00390CB91C